MRFQVMAQVDANAQGATNDMLAALESLIGGDPSLAVVYGNSALAAVIMIFQAHQIDPAMNRELFNEIWAPIVGSTITL